jgi:hypothetical protein
MCTVTFLPLPDSGFLLTSNRDEHQSRAGATVPKRYRLGNRTVFFPKDGPSGGTWIATDEQRHTLCLLNGAFDPHAPRPPYRHSRGRIILDFFGYENETDFSIHYDFSDLEPFTLLVVEYDPVLTLVEIRWDGTRFHRTRLDATRPRLWSSATLYPVPIREKRERWFTDWLGGQAAFSQEALVGFHRVAGDGDPHHDLLMQRPDGLRTVSITSVERSAAAHRIVYHDLQTQIDSTFRILS